LIMQNGDPASIGNRTKKNRYNNAKGDEFLI
jgi:hypothetical protein